MDDEVIRGFATAVCAIVCDLFSRHRAKKFRIRTLETRLLKEDYKWRSLGQLSRAIGQSPEATTDLLIEIGARRSASKKDVWTLER